MNRKEFLAEFAKRSGMDIDEARKIDDLIEKVFIIGKNNKKKTIDILVTEAGLSNEQAERIYEVRSQLIKDALKDKLKHPFKSQD